jgi:hypothetical protein
LHPRGSESNIVPVVSSSASREEFGSRASMHTSALARTPLRDSFGHPHSLTLSMFGVRVEIRIDDGALLPRILECLPPGWTAPGEIRIDRRYEFLRLPPGPAAAEYVVLADRVFLAQSSGLDELSGRFQSDLELFLAVRARTHAIVHAGVVGWQGRAIVIPGGTLSGKTTLVEALIRQGADYYSDEYAVLGPDGLVSPFPRPLWIRQNPQVRQVCTAEELGAVTGSTPLPVRSIVVTEYQPGAVWQPRQLTPGEAVLALLSNAPAARHQPGYLMRTFGTTARGAVTWSGARGDATDFATHLLNQFSAESR